MKKILTFSILVCFVSLYAYFQIHLKKQKNRTQRTVLIESQKPVELNLTSRFSRVKLKLKDNLWFVTTSHSYPADQDFIERNLNLMKKAPILSTFPLPDTQKLLEQFTGKEKMEKSKKTEKTHRRKTKTTKQVNEVRGDPYGFNPPKAFMEIIYPDGLRKRLLMGKIVAPQNGLYILDKDAEQIFVVHNVFGQFFYYPSSMFLSKNLPIHGEKIKTIRLEKSDSMEKQDLKVVWEVKNESQDYATVIYKGESKKIPKQKLLLFFKKIKNLQLTDHKFKPMDLSTENLKTKSESSHSFNKFPSLSIETEKGLNRFNFDYEKGKFYSQSHAVSARFKLSSLREFSEEIKKLMKSEK